MGGVERWEKESGGKRCDVNMEIGVRSTRDRGRIGVRVTKNQ